MTASAAAHDDGTDTIDVSDDDIAALTVTIVDAAISENGGATTATVSRNTDTTGDLIVTLTSSDTGEVTVSPATLTFTPANWNTAQPVTLTAADDPTVDGPQRSGDHQVGVGRRGIVQAGREPYVVAVAAARPGDRLLAPTAADDEHPHQRTLSIPCLVPGFVPGRIPG